MHSRQEQPQGSLGRDFLTYLCYRSDDGGGQLDLPPRGEQCVLLLDGKIVFEDDRDLPPCTVTYTGDDVTGEDLKQAIRAGKKVREARFRVEKGAQTWVFTLRADRFDIAGLKIDMPDARDADERFYGRIYSIEALNELLDACYDHFIGEVHGKHWKTSGYPRLQQWLGSGGRKR
jgi:recombination associated protein RdgC